MPVRAYDDVDPEKVGRLNRMVFNWDLSPGIARKIRRLDANVTDYFALYDVEGDHIRAQVGSVVVPIETTEGRLLAGIIWGVCTRPGAARRGIAERLMLENHRRLRDRGARYCFLATSKAFVAHDLYRKLGYQDIAPFMWSAGSHLPAGGKMTDVAFVASRTPGAFDRIFKSHSRGLLGFVHRQKDFIRLRNLWFATPLDFAGIFKRHGMPVGFAVGNMSKGHPKVLELCCPDVADMGDCLLALAGKFKSRRLDFAGFATAAERAGLAAGGLDEPEPSWGTLMALDLDGKKGFGKLDRLLDVKNDRFQVSEMDCY